MIQHLRARRFQIHREPSVDEFHEVRRTDAAVRIRWSREDIQAARAAAKVHAGRDVHDRTCVEREHARRAPLRRQQLVAGGAERCVRVRGDLGLVAERHLGVLLDNVRRFATGAPLVNVVDKAQWFSDLGK